MLRARSIGYKNIKAGKSFCVHGKTEDGKDCAEIPEESEIDACGEDASSEDCTFAKENKYDFDTLKAVKCVCGKGTACKNTIANAGIASVGSTVFVRIILGTGLEVLGPVNVQCMLLTFGGTMVALSSQINGPLMYTVLRFLIGERAVHVVDLRRNHGRPLVTDQRTPDVHGPSVPDRLCWGHVRDEPVLVLAHVCAERGRNGECDSSRLGQPRRRRDADLHHVVPGDPDALGRNR